MSTSKEVQKKSFSKLHWYCLTCDRIAVNLHTKHQILGDKVDNLEKKKNKVDKEKD